MVADASLKEVKLHEIKQFIHKLTIDLENGNKRASMGDLNYIIDKSVALKYLLKAELEDEE